MAIFFTLVAFSAIFMFAMVATLRPRPQKAPVQAEFQSARPSGVVRLAR